MKNIIILVTAISLIACNSELLDQVPTANAKQVTLSYQLKQMHFVVLRQIEHIICFNDYDAPDNINYKFIDVHLAWLNFSNDSTSNYYPYEIIHKVTYTPEIVTQTPESLCDKIFSYHNGFEIDDYNLIQCHSQIESFDHVTIPISKDEEIEFSPPELECDELTPLTLTFTNYNSSEITGIITLAFKDKYNNLSETLELPVTFKI